MKMEQLSGDYTDVLNMAVDSMGFVWLNKGDELLRLNSGRSENFSSQFTGEKVFRVYSIGSKTFVSGTFGVQQIVNNGFMVEFKSVFNENNTPEIKRGVLDIAPISGLGHLFIFENRIMITEKKGGYIYDLALNRDSWEVMSWEKGIVLFSSRGRIIQVNTHTSEIYEQDAGVEINGVIPFGKNKYLAGGSGLYVISMENREISLSENYFPNKAFTVSCLSGNPGKGILIGTVSNGLFTFKNEGELWQLQPLKMYNDPHQVDELFVENVNAIYSSPGGDFWVTSKEKVLKFSGNLFFNATESFPFDNIISLSVFEEGVLCVVPNGIYHLGFNGYHVDVEELPNPDEGLVMSSVQSGKYVWMGTNRGKLYEWDSGKHRLIADLSYRGLDLFYMESDYSGNVWICQAPEVNQPFKGIARVSFDKNITIYDEKSGLDTRIIVARQSPEGTMYFGGRGEEDYLYMYDSINDRFVNLSVPLKETVHSFFETHDLTIDDNGRIWMATSNGLYKYEEGRVEKIEVIKTDLDWEVTSIEYVNGRVWFGTDILGVIAYDPETTQYAVYGEREGLISKRLYYRNLVFDRSNHLWAGTIEGLSVSQESFPSPATSSPPVFMYANGQKAEHGYRLSFQVHDSVHFGLSNTYFPPKKEVYAEYKLIDTRDSVVILKDKKWLDMDSVFTLSLRLNDKGRFKLLVRTKDYNESQWSKFDSVEFDVIDPLYNTWYAYTAYVLVIVFVIFMFFSSQLKALGNRVHVQSAEIKLKEKELMSYSKVIAHDMKSSIRGISSVVQLLLMESDKYSEEDKEYMNLLKDKAKRLYSLLDWAVMFSKLESKIVDRRQLRMKSIIQNVINELKIKSNMSVKIFDDDIEYRGAYDHFYEVFYQLLENAVKYNDKEKGEVQINCKKTKGQLMIFVKDNGPGINVKDFNELFKEFHVESDMTSTEGYAGLGLMMVKKIIELYNGEINVYSKKGVYSEFIISLPL